MNYLPAYTVWAKLKAVAALSGIVFVLSLALDYSGLLQPYSLKTLDILFRQVPLPAADQRVVVIAIDQPDIDFFQEQGIGWPWPRELYAPILDFCRRGGAKAVLLDLLFTETSFYGKEDDRKFADAIASSGNVFLPFFLSQRSKEPESSQDDILRKSGLTITGVPPAIPKQYQSLLPPILSLTTAVRGLGNVESSPDTDGVFRRLPLVVRFRDRWLPTLAFAAFQQMQEPGPWKFDNGDLVHGYLRIPLDRNGNLLLKFRGPSRSHTRYSAANVIQSEARCCHGLSPIYPPSDFIGKWVLLGTTAPGLLDLKPSPLAPVYPGVELHATLLDNLLQEDFLRVVPSWILWTWSLILISGITVLILCVSRLVIILSSLLLFALLHICLSAMLFWQSWLLPPVLPAVALGLASVLSAAFSYATEGRQKQAIRTMFSHYLSEGVINHLLQHPEKLILGGERRRLTLFFSDLAGFTTLSERLAPEVVVTILNEYLSQMTDIILEEQGVVDKFEGDAIMAFWGAPLLQEDHARRACRAALRQQAVLRTLNQRFSEKGWPQLHCRIGLHTGEAVVGNLGSRKRFDYTVIGDTVNLASRLEGLNKFYGSTILASESTVQECQGSIEFLEIDLVAVKGRQTPVRVFEPLALREDLTVFQARVRDAFGEGLELYRRGHFEQAALSFELSLKYWPEHGPSQTFRRRCQEWLNKPPAADWDAVFRPDKK